MKATVRTVAGTVLPDGKLAETVFDPAARNTAYLIGDEHGQTLQNKIVLSDQEHLVPPKGTNNLIRHGVLLLPSGVKQYGDVDVLLWSIEAYIARYCDLPKGFIKTAAAYVLLTWVYDRFSELPYLRLSGSYGTGKSRFLLTVGSLCYRPIFASGASTIAPIFHSLNDYRGTLVMDEADFRYSDEKSDVIKILNNGNLKGFPILRCMKTAHGEFDPQAFNVFGPKIIATRGRYEDPALESRFITYGVRPKQLSPHVPINMPAEQAQEASELRNQLLLFRFKNWHRTDIRPDLDTLAVEGRVAQIFRPLLSVISNSEDRSVVAEQAARSQAKLKESRENRIEVRVLSILKKLREKKLTLSLQLIVEHLELEHGLVIAPRSLGHVLRSKLGLQTVKRNGNFVVSDLSASKVSELLLAFGLLPEAASAEPKANVTEGQRTSPTSPNSLVSKQKD